MEQQLVNDVNKIDSKIKKEVDDVKSVIRDTIIDFHNYIFPKYINNYKNYLWFVAERMSTLDKWQTNINYPMVSSTVDTIFWNVFDFWYEFWIKELWLKKLCTKAFDFRWTWRSVLKDVLKETVIIWKWYIKDYLIKEVDEDEFFGKKIKTDIKTPSMIYISAFDVMYDRSKWLDKSSYKIIRTFQTWNDIKKKVTPLIRESYKWKLTIDDINKKIDSFLSKYKQEFWHRFSMYDYNPVKSLSATQQWYESLSNNKTFYELPNALKYTDLVSWYMNTQNSVREDAKNYFLNDKDSSYELVEYTTETRKYIFVNWNLIYFGDRKFNVWEIREATFSSIPWSWNAMWVADKQWSLQDIQNTLWNAFIDNIKLNLWPMFRVSGNIPQWKNGTLDFKSFRVIKTQWQNDIEKIQLWVTDFAPINFMNMVDATSQKDFSMNNYLTGWQGAIERVQWWIDLKFNQYKAKLTPFTDSIDIMMWWITKSWILMYLKFFTKEELWKLWVEVEDVYETDSKTWLEKFKTFTLNKVDIRDIIDESNITFTYNSLDKATKEAIRWQIMNNLQYVLQYALDKVNMDQIALLMAWLDFDPLKLFKKEEPKNKVATTENPIVEQIEEPVEEQQSEEDIMAQLQSII